ncbi:MAG: DJ-1/PfpI family protein [bacterium]
MQKKSVVLFLAEKDFNEQAYLVVKNTLSKNLYNIFVCSDTSGLCKGSGGIKVKNDILLSNLNEANFAALIIVGGDGIKDYYNNLILHKNIQKFNTKKKVVAAICAAPVILAKAGILTNKSAACNINQKKELEKEGVIYNNIPVFQDKNIITAQQAINSQEFINNIINTLNKSV